MHPLEPALPVLDANHANLHKISCRGTLLTLAMWTVSAAAFAAAAAISFAPLSGKQIGGSAQPQNPAEQISFQRARNIILFIGDGMGDSEITAARYYSVGASGRLAMDTLPFTGAYTTWSVEEDAPSRPHYVPDSAATGTAWATGSKTSNGRISTSPATDRELKTILEYAREYGYRTGNVTTAELTDATPAVLAAHVSHRSCMGPADMRRCPADRKAAGGPGSIAEQLVDHQVDVLLGGGAERFAQKADSGISVESSARSNGYVVVHGRSELDSISRGRVLGLFAAGNMTTEWTGQRAAPFPSNVASPQSCRPQSRPSSEPTLAEMTAAALRLLEPSNSASAGFFLQVEGASIDKQDHAADPCGQIGETVAFDRAVRLGLDFAATHRDTLLIVTADHGHSSQIVETPSALEHPAGLMSTLRTREGSLLTLSYGTAVGQAAQGHTGTQVRIAARGPFASGVLGVIDQTDLFHLLLRSMRAPAQTSASLR